VQKAAVVPTGHTTILANPIELPPVLTVLDTSVGGLHEGKFSGGPCVLLAEPVSHGAKAGTSETRTGDAPIGTV